MKSIKSGETNFFTISPFKHDFPLSSYIRIILMAVGLLLFGPGLMAGGFLPTTGYQAWATEGSSERPVGASILEESHPTRIFLPVILRDAPYSTVISPEGGTISWLGGNLLITFPAGAFSKPVTLFLTTPLNLPAGLYDYGLTIRLEAYDFSGNPVPQLNHPATITFSFEGQDYWVDPKLNLYSQQADGTWLPLSTFYGPGPKQFYAQTGHLSSFGLFGANSGDFQKMAVDNAGKIYFLDGPAIFRQSLDSPDRELYYDLSSVIGATSTFGDLTMNRATDDLYIGNAEKVYKLTSGKQLTTLFTTPYTGNGVRGLHFSPYYQALFVSAVYGTYQINPDNGSLIRDILAGYGSQDVATDSTGGIFVLYRAGQQIPSFETMPTDSMIVYWPDIIHDGSCFYNLLGFLTIERLFVDDSDNLLVPNAGGDAVSVVGGDEVTVTGFLKRVPKPGNVVVSGDSLLVASRGGLKIKSAAQRDTSFVNPQLATQGTISGKGSLVEFLGADPVPAHNVLRINGRIQRNLASYSPGTGAVTFDLAGYPRCGLSNALTPPLTDPLAAYSAPVHDYRISAGISVSASGALAVPEPGNWQYVDIYSEHQVARGEWGIFENSARVISNDGLFPQWDVGTDGGALAYQFNQPGRFQFTTNSKTIYVNVTPGGAPADTGWCRELPAFHVDPQAGTIFRAYGTTLEVPDGALPGTAVYTLEMKICNTTNPGKDPLSASSYGYQIKFTPEPTQLLKPIVLRLPYDPNQPGDPPQAAYFDSVVGDLVRLDSQSANGLVSITFPIGTYSATSGALAGSSKTGSLGADPVKWGSFNQIASSLWWAVGLPNGVVADAHFLVLYNTHDVGESYAQSALDALDAAWDLFARQGYAMPTNLVTVKIASWIATGQRPGVTLPSLQNNFVMFLSDKLNTEMLQDTAVHEFFHVLQRNNLSTAGYLRTPTWFLEGTATWAQWAVYPAHTDYLIGITADLDFPRTGFDSWTGLTVEQQYATMALAAYLEEKKGAGSIRQVLCNMGTLSGMKESLESVAGNWGVFYSQFAKDYWMQKFAPVDTWNLEPAMQSFPVTQASNTLLNRAVPALSSGLIRAYYNNSLNPPESFYQGYDSVARMPNSCALGEAWVFNKAKTELGSFIGVIDPAGPDFAVPLRKIGDYTSSSPAYFLYIANDRSGSTSCNQQLVWEAPTIATINPPSVPKGGVAFIGISGDGFGPKTGVVIDLSSNNYTPTSWTAGSVTFTLPAQPNPRTITIQVQTPTGALSNPKTLTITN